MRLTPEIKYEPLRLRSFMHLELLLEQLVLIQAARRLIGSQHQAVFLPVLTLTGCLLCYARLKQVGN